MTNHTPNHLNSARNSATFWSEENQRERLDYESTRQRQNLGVAAAVLCRPFSIWTDHVSQFSSGQGGLREPASWISERLQASTPRRGAVVVAREQQNGEQRQAANG